MKILFLRLRYIIKEIKYKIGKKVIKMSRISVKYGSVSYRRKPIMEDIYGTRKMCFSKVPYIFRLETFSISHGECIKYFNCTFNSQITSDVV